MILIGLQDAPINWADTACLSKALRWGWIVEVDDDRWAADKTGNFKTRQKVISALKGRCVMRGWHKTLMP